MRAGGRATVSRWFRVEWAQVVSEAGYMLCSREL
jgi:hypothetical protein